jgi:hypothetical protein
LPDVAASVIRHLSVSVIPIRAGAQLGAWLVIGIERPKFRSTKTTLLVHKIVAVDGELFVAKVDVSVAKGEEVPIADILTSLPSKLDAISGNGITDVAAR